MRYATIILMLFVLGCKKDKEIQLNYQEEKLQEVMIDLYIAAEAVKKTNSIVGDSLRWKYREQIEQIHDVDMPRVEEDLEALKLDPERYKYVHQMVNDSLKKLEDYYKNQKEYGR